ncbi:hypothetical protein HELRODRAFT_181445 [Helobdella robusta]|uniref:Uncharacterized protein n=1 Tax=Helobdella robusta TaxID=6412 RepID=T1FH05_HELRO|nr:hypothetical protein HELRODRAFT_181445 [Helobdella robusta]ESN92397.1 hypothetical protein HELRODRAFT_181445 [Helobdella robusta]
MSQMPVYFIRCNPRSVQTLALQQQQQQPTEQQIYQQQHQQQLQQQQIFNNPNIFHVQTSTAVQIAFGPVSPIFHTGALYDPRYMGPSSSNHGDFIMLGSADSATGVPVLPNDPCFMDPAKFFTLKPKGANGCGGYVLASGNRTGFKFSPY